MSKEAMKLALEALEDTLSDDPYPYSLESKAITALREALAQQALDKMAENARELGLDYEPAQQEPVAWMIWGDNNVPSLTFTKPADKYVFDSLYTFPPAQRTWVGLDEKDFSAINQSCLTKLQAATSAESILKEKNT